MVRSSQRDFSVHSSPSEDARCRTFSNRHFADDARLGPTRLLGLWHNRSLGDHEMLADRRAKDGRSGHDLVQDRLDRLLDFRRQVSAYVTDAQGGVVQVLVDGLGHCRGNRILAIARGRAVVVIVIVVAAAVMVVGGDKSCVEISYRKYEAPTVAVDSERH